jgi:hypothetical protein
MVSEDTSERFVFRSRSSPKTLSCVGASRKQKRWLGRCLFVCLTCAQQTSYIPWTMCAMASFLHDNQVPHPKHQCFCDLISTKIRKARAYYVDSCFRCAASLRTHPHMYHQRSTPSCIHLHLHVKGTVLLSSLVLQAWWKSLRKSFVMHLFERSTVWCSLLELKMSYSAVASAHKSACIHVHGNSWYQCRLSLSSLSSLSVCLSVCLSLSLSLYIRMHIRQTHSPFAKTPFT